MQNVTSLNHYNLRKPFQYLLIIPSFVISLSIIRAADGCDLKLFSYVVLTFFKFKVPLVNAEKPKLIDVCLRIAKMDRLV